MLRNGVSAVGARVWVWPSGTAVATDSVGWYRLDVFRDAGKLLIMAQQDNLLGEVEVSLGPQPLIVPDIVLVLR